MHPARKLFVEDVHPAVVAGMIAEGAIGILDWGEPAHMIFVLVGKADPSASRVIERLNLVKGRPKDQVLAVAGFPELAASLADLEQCAALGNAAERNRTTRLDILCELFQYPVAVLLHAGPAAPAGVVHVTADGRRTVMLAGQVPRAGDCAHADFFNDVSWELATRHGQVMAATSANLSGESTYSIHEQEDAYEALKHHVDFVVMRRDIPRVANGLFISSSVWDLTGSKPLLTRWGSKHPDRFKSVLGDFDVAANMTVIPGAEQALRPRKWWSNRISRANFPMALWRLFRHKF